LFKLLNHQELNYFSELIQQGYGLFSQIWTTSPLDPITVQIILNIITLFVFVSFSCILYMDLPSQDINVKPGLGHRLLPCPKPPKVPTFYDLKVMRVTTNKTIRNPDGSLTTTTVASGYFLYERTNQTGFIRYVWPFCPVSHGHAITRQVGRREYGYFGIFIDERYKPAEMFIMPGYLKFPITPLASFITTNHFPIIDGRIAVQDVHDIDRVI
jgi:hypothetical protein